MVELEGMGGGGEVWLEVCFFQWKRIKTNQQYKLLIWGKNCWHMYFDEKHDVLCHLFLMYI